MLLRLLRRFCCARFDFTAGVVVQGVLSTANRKPPLSASSRNKPSSRCHVSALRIVRTMRNHRLAGVSPCAWIRLETRRSRDRIRTAENKDTAHFWVLPHFCCKGIAQCDEVHRILSLTVVTIPRHLPQFFWQGNDG